MYLYFPLLFVLMLNEIYGAMLEPVKYKIGGHMPAGASVAIPNILFPICEIV